MLRDVLEADLPLFFEHQCDPVAARMAAFESRERDAFMEHWKTKVLGNPNTTTKTIVVDGHVAGYVGSWEQGGQRLVGYWIGRAYWGKGVATRALLGFLAHETTRPVHAWVAEDNVASIRVLEKCGFRRDDAVGRHEGDDGVVELLMRLDGGETPTPPSGPAH